MSVGAQKAAKWATSYPLSKALRQTWNAKNTGTTKKDQSRVDIVSPKLCGEFQSSRRVSHSTGTYTDDDG